VLSAAKGNLQNKANSCRAKLAQDILRKELMIKLELLELEKTKPIQGHYFLEC
jgi:hypothetical protein